VKRAWSGIRKLTRSTGGTGATCEKGGLQSARRNQAMKQVALDEGEQYAHLAMSELSSPRGRILQRKCFLDDSLFSVTWEMLAAWRERLSGGRATAMHRRWARKRLAIVDGMGAFVAIVAIVLLVRTTTSDAQRDVLELLSRATRGGRPAEPRFVGIAYGPWRQRLGEGVDAATNHDRLAESLGTLAPQIRHALGRLRGAPADRLRGVATIFDGLANDETESLTRKLDIALGALEAAAREDPNSAAIQSDLAAAYLVRGRTQSDPGDRQAALEASDRALSIDPKSKEAHFNRALVLDDFYLWLQARDAWETYLALDRRSAWADEARRHLNRLDDSIRGTDWDHVRARLRAASEGGNETAVEHYVELNTRFAREFGEQQLLSEWGRAIQVGDTGRAAGILSAAESIGRALERFNGDQLLLDSVKAIRYSERSTSRSEVYQLAAAHVVLAGAWSLVERLDYEGAERKLTKAMQAFSGSRSPMARWVMLYLAICRYQRSEYESAYRELGKLVQAPDADCYPSLLARVLRVQALIERLWGNLAVGLRQYEAALRVANRTREPESIAGMQVSLAGTYDALGDRRRFWQLVFTALEQRNAFSNTERLYMVLAEPAHRLARWGLPLSAVPFQQEAVEVAQQSEDPVLVADAFRELADLREQSGDSKAALEALDRSARASEAISDASVRAFFALDDLRSRGRILIQSDPEAAEQALSKAIVEGERIGYHVVLPSVYLDRAKLYRRQGRTSLTDQDLSHAVHEIESQRDRIDEVSYRVSFFDQSQEVFDELITLAIERAQSERSFEISERARARALLDQVLDRGRASSGLRAAATPPPTVTVADLRHSLGPGAVVVEYGLFGDDAFAWIITRDRFEFIHLPTSASELLGLVNQFRAAVQKPNPDAMLRSILDELYLRLMRPMESSIDEAQLVVVVPHRFLCEIPFSALRDPETGKYLFQRVAVNIAPSASVFATASLRGARTHARSARVLAVGDPAFDQLVGPDLPRLPGSRSEAEAVFKMYSRHSRLLLGKGATRDAVVTLAPSFSVLHLATHGIVEGSQPLESRLLLARDPGESAARGELTASDVLSLDLHATSLVVLSSCESAVGALSATEGPLSLTRPFLAAGALAVVASLWQVDDRRTQVLLTQLHRALLRGVPVAEALREARMSLLSDDPSTPLRILGAFEVYGSGTVRLTTREGR
jgi:CHAT domain-containing protein